MPSFDPKSKGEPIALQQSALSPSSNHRRSSDLCVTGLSVLRACPRVAAGAALTMVLGSLSIERASAAPCDRTAPTAPAQLHVTSIGAYQVSLAWQQSVDARGTVAYRLNVDGRELAVPAGATGARLTWGLSPNTAYSFSVTALDAAGNRSRPSNVVRATLLPDVTRPATPEVTLAYAGSDRVSVTWTGARDDGPSVTYELSIDGNSVLSGLSATSASIGNLAPDTRYSVQVRAVDAAGNASLASAALVVSTGPSHGEDTAAPSTPGRFSVFDDYCGDVFLVWDKAVDERDPSSAITYDIYVNDRLQGSVSDRTWAAFNLTEVGLTRFALVAVDSEDNRSQPATFSLDLGGCDP